jgi:hypothetical protein
MTGHRMITNTLIIEAAGDTAALWSADCDSNAGYNDEIIVAVRRAIDGLDPDEAEIVRMYHLQGMTYPQISALIGCPPRRLVNRHRTARKKLRLRLHRMLAGRYHVPARLRLDCPLCDHPRAIEIDDLIRAKREDDTWRKTMRILKIDFDIAVIRPQILITHRKYHMI